VFWLNVLEVPPKPGESGGDTNKLQLAFHSRIKLFFRPPNLRGSAQDAPAAVTWRLVDAHGKPGVEAYNPSDYHVSFIRIEVTTGNGQTGSDDDGGMVGPGEHHTFFPAGLQPTQTALQVHYTTLNDLGGAEDGSAPLQAAAAGPPH
jgi:P pilus assembly chaperone PapD